MQPRLWMSRCVFLSPNLSGIQPFFRDPPEMTGPVTDFRELFCEHFGCPREAYEKKVFWRCLHRRSFPLAALVYLVNRDFFQKDFDTIRQLGITKSQGEFQKEVEDYYFNIRSYGNALQRIFRVRISGQKLVRLSRLVHHAAGSAPPSRPAQPPGNNAGRVDT